MKENEQKNRRILVIDDNEAIHKDFRAILGGVDAGAINVDEEEAAIFGAASDLSEQEGFQVDSALQGKEGLEKIRQALQEGRPYAMAFVDVRMPPGWDGVETTQRIWQEYPDLQVVICTAHSDYQWQDIVKKLGETEKLMILKKPFDNIEVYQLASALTEKWLLLQQTRLKQKELEAANAAKSEFLANMSHELRTPLHSILSFSSFGIKKYATTGPEKLHDYFNRIQRSAKTLLKLLDNLLDLAKLESCKMRFDFQPSNLGALIASITEEFSSLASEKNLMIQCDMSSFNEEVTLDSEKIKQVLRNILSNAVKFSPECRTIKIGICRAESSVVVSVQDQGPGIPENELEAVFDKFVQSSKTNSGAGGTGLGLAICFEIITAHKGRIWAENNPQGGVTLSFEIPISEWIGTETEPVLVGADSSLERHDNN